MRVTVGGKRVDLDDKDLLGMGGEARVYRFSDLALKIYHAVDPKLPAAERSLQEKLLDEKLSKIQAFPSGLDPFVVTPIDLVTDVRGRPIGYSMRAIPDAHDLACLSQRSWREGVVSNELVGRLFLRLHDSLSTLHGRHVVVGDLNDSNVLFTCGGKPVRTVDPWFIDADSMQFGPYGCVVGHERFLDPRLYGTDLTASRVFSPETDWYAFSVLVFASLVYVHPYGGIHPKYPTLLRRAEGRVSVLHSGVTLPRAAVTPRILPDDLVTWFEEVFDRDRRGPFPPALLGMRWTRCSCGLEHARSVCPVCSTKTMVSVATVLSSGRCQARVVLKTDGRVLHAVYQGGLRYVYCERGRTLREDGSVVTDEISDPGARFVLSGSSTWIGVGSRLSRFSGAAAVETSSTETLGSLPIFDANGTGVFRLEDGWIVDVVRGIRIGQVLQNQTWMKVGGTLGVGFYRAGLITVGFLFRTDRPGLMLLSMPPIRGRLLDAHAVFDDHHALLLVSTENNGVTTNAMHLFAEDGRKLASASGSPQETRMLASLRGKALFNGQVVCSTDDGLLLLKVDSVIGRFDETKLFGDTRGFVDTTTDILPGPGGSVYVVTTKEIVHLTLS